MCGRYAFDDTKEIFELRMLLEEIADIFGESAAAGIKTGEVFPTDTAAVVAQQDNGFRPVPMTWGFPLANSSRPIINARQETLLEKPMFQKSIFKKKLLIPCTGFFEWRKDGTKKIKYHIRIKNADYFYLAGLYNAFRFRDIVTQRFVIITAPANSDMRPIHHRMPLIVPKSQPAHWLNVSGDYTDAIKKLYDNIPRLEITEHL